MPRISLTSGIYSLIILFASLASLSPAASPTESLLPPSVEGYLSVRNMPDFVDRWEQTQIGQLLQQPEMEAFVEDLRTQIEKKWSDLDDLGLTIEDLQGVPSGEAAVAVLMPSEDKSAIIALADVKGNEQQVDELLEKIDANMTERRAVKSERELLGATVTIYTLPRREGETEADVAVIFQQEDLLCATDNLEVAGDVLKRFAAMGQPTLAEDKAFAAVMERAASHAGADPDARWFIDPFGFVEAARASDLADEIERREPDGIKILSEQGFDAIQAIGGYVNVHVDDAREMIHRTYIYAPPVAGAGDDRYTLAARMLRFPNGPDLSPQAWVPRELATYASGYCEIQQAFEFSFSLIDALVEEEGIMDEIIQSIKEDPDGPQIDVRADFVKQLGERVTILGDYDIERPIYTESERLLVAIEAADAEAVAATVEKTMATDPDAHRREIEGYTVWEIIDQDRDERGRGDRQVFNPVAGGGRKRPKPKEEEGLPNSAVCVAHGHLLVASHVDFLKRVLQKHDEREQLNNAFDYRRTMVALETLQPAHGSMLHFGRMAETLRPNYELFQQGKLPESNTLLAHVLNELLIDEEETDRTQEFDGSKLPDYGIVRRYLGLMGNAVVTEDEGWFITGVVLN